MKYPKLHSDSQFQNVSMKGSHWQQKYGSQKRPPLLIVALKKKESDGFWSVCTKAIRSSTAIRQVWLHKQNNTTCLECFSCERIIAGVKGLWSMHIVPIKLIRLSNYFSQNKIERYRVFEIIYYILMIWHIYAMPSVNATLYSFFFKTSNAKPITGECVYRLWKSWQTLPRPMHACQTLGQAWV